MGFLGVFEGIHQEEGCAAVSVMFGPESMLRGIEHVEVFPGVADTVSEYAGLELSEDLKEADGPKVLYVGEFCSFGQRDEPALFPEVWNMLSGP